MTAWSKELLEPRISECVLQAVLSDHELQSIEQGLLHVHQTGPYFGAKLLIPELREIWTMKDEAFMLRLAEMFKGYSAMGMELCIPNFAEDLGLPLLRGYNPRQLFGILKHLFSLFQQSPRYRVSLNFGDELENEAMILAETVLQVLDQGATFLEPQIVLRVRRGRNLERDSRGFSVLLRALDLARTREGISFALLDSPVNRSLGGLVAYNALGLRVEPISLDFYRGTRGQQIGGIVSLNMPKAWSFGPAGVVESLDGAARILATLHNISPASVGDETKKLFPLVINLAGVSSYRISHELFEMLDLLSLRIKELRQRYNLNFILASTGHKVAFRDTVVDALSHQQGSALLANMEQYLPGGHCLWLSAGAHKTADELYFELLNAAEKGISFVRFRVQDVRCMACHLVVAAPGPCPNCSSLGRKKIVDEEDGLRAIAGDGRSFLNN